MFLICIRNKTNGHSTIIEMPWNALGFFCDITWRKTTCSRSSVPSCKHLPTDFPICWLHHATPKASTNPSPMMRVLAHSPVVKPTPQKKNNNYYQSSSYSNYLYYLTHR